MMTSLYLQIQSVSQCSGERIDLSHLHDPQQMHGSARVCSSLVKSGVWQRVSSPREDASNVLCCFPLAYLNCVGTQVDGVTSQPEEALRSSMRDEAQLRGQPFPIHVPVLPQGSDLGTSGV